MNTLKKAERLSSKKIIDSLFNEGNSFNLYPFKIIWINTELPGDYPAQVLITVSKRNFRKAVQRNRIKRIIREAYRYNKSDFYNFLTINKQHCALAIVYTGKSMPVSDTIHEEIGKVMERLMNNYE